MIIRGGENIYPKEIEDFIYTHPKVKDVQVIGVPSKDYGEEIMACVILKDGETMTEEEVKDFVRTHMAKHKVPRYVSFVKEFPMTPPANPQVQNARGRRGAAKAAKGQQHRHRVREPKHLKTGRYKVEPLSENIPAGHHRCN